MSHFCGQVLVDARELQALELKSGTFCVIASPRFLVADWEICWAQEGLRPRHVRRNQNCLLALVATQCMLVSRFLCAILAALIPVISTKLQPEVSFPVIYGLR